MGPRLPAFNRWKVLVMMTSLPNIVILGAQGLLMLMGSKFLLKITRLQNIVPFILMFCGLVIFIKNFDPIDTKRPWAPKITTFCSEVILTKTFMPIKSRRPWLPILFHIFFNKAILVLGCSLLIPGVFGLDLSLTSISYLFCLEENDNYFVVCSINERLSQ